MSSQIEIKFIDKEQDTCVYSPGPDCEGNPEKPGYLTKIQKKTDRLENAMKMAEIILHIPQYEYYMNTILKTCPLNIASMSSGEVDKCDILDRDRTEEYLSVKMKNIGNKKIEDFILSLDSRYQIIETVETYFYLIDAIEILQENRIIHFNINTSTILYNETNCIPILIDFGFAFNMDDEERKKEVFDSIQTINENGPIEIYILSKVWKKMGEPASESDFVSFLEEYMQNDFFRLSSITEEDKRKFREEYRSFYSPFVGTGWKNMVDTVWNNTDSYYKTWDYYSISMVYLMILEKVGEPDSVLGNRFINELKKTILSFSQERIFKKNIQQLNGEPDEENTFIQEESGPQIEKELVMTEPLESKPIDDSEEPIDESEEPIDNLEEPIDNLEEPIDNLEEPIDDSEEPIDESEEPVDDSEEPVDQTKNPEKNLSNREPML